jgi:RNA polymerase sigma factor (sigma-70 family)
MTMTLSTNDINRTDADLITLSRSGDRRAFGQIVRRYQAMISGLVYAACGDIHRSEDVAQETFISAWKSLSGLRDAAKLPGWLCQIARRRLADQSRSAPSKEIQFSRAFEMGQEPAAPESGSISTEEVELLWRTLSHIPQPYRETLVLFYRQEKSVAQVAAAMETSEASVRQRLSRGREMLREEVAAVLERNLVRTSPNQLFTQQVVAALPALAAQGAGLSAGAKAAVALKGAGLVTSMIGWLAPIGFFLGLIYGTVQEVRQSKSPRQRQVAKAVGIWMWSALIVFVVAMNWMMHAARIANWDLASRTYGCVIIGGLFGMALFAITVFGRWRMVRILREENIVEYFPKLAPWKFLAFTFPVVAISLGWLVKMALMAGDQLSVDILGVVIVLQSFYLAWRTPRLQPDHPIRHTFENLALTLLVTAVMLNWKLLDWVGTIYSIDLGQVSRLVPMWSVNAGMATVFASICILALMSRRRAARSDLT